MAAAKGRTMNANCCPTNPPVKIDESWKKVLKQEFSKEYMKDLKKFLHNELKQGKTIYPHGSDIFSAFNHTPFDQVKVVIMGQDPYHGPNQAHGLCFSVRPGVTPPPSLKNIYKELHNDLDITPPSHGCLLHWAKQGVLLLNAVLTVEKGRAASHQGKGWELFTDKIVEILNSQREKIVFILWGSPAQRKCKNIDTKRHFVLKSPHPSPLSAHRGFFGCKHFSKTNEILKNIGSTPVDWVLPTVPTI